MPESFVVLAGASAVSLWLAHALWPFDGFPSAFEPANRLLQSDEKTSTDQWLPIARGLSAGIALSLAIQWRRLQKAYRREWALPKP
ncbi:hypothetical protein [Sphingomonas sp. Leaf38]|uniref:hypothetical protein n=1 Tax=Sphingomonas sp. Leaf38 TaxID=1736217 RepID=UPI0006FB09AA|nr:hypothetical protein [Sphingomonas sp. Leaf38]KQN32978.1 hypothetical protein ASE88_03245 [Sphingomonas sp. Leaf38]